MSTSNKEALSSWVFELNDLLFSDSEKAALDSWVKQDIDDKHAEFCIDLAEELFRQQDLNKAIVSILSANLKNPNLAKVSGYFYAYMIHKVSSKIRNWYAVLRIKGGLGTPVQEIKKRYKAMTLMVHPDKCSSVAAEGATKLLNSAWEVLSDPERKKAYDHQLIKNQNKFSLRYQADQFPFPSMHSSKRSRQQFGSSQSQTKWRRVVIDRKSTMFTPQIWMLFQVISARNVSG